MIYLITNENYLFNNPLLNKYSIEKALEDLKNLEEIDLDIETTGLDRFTEKILTIQLGNFENQYIFVIESFNYQIPQQLKDFLNFYTGVFVGQNLKFDLQFLFIQDVIIKKVYDTMLAEQIITFGLDLPCDLKSLVQKYCAFTLDKSERDNIIKKGLTENSLIYGADDIKYLSTIKRKQLTTIKELNLETALKLDNSFVVVLAYIEYCGIKLDWDKWKLKYINNLEELNSFREDLNKEVENIASKNPIFNKFLDPCLDLFSSSNTCNINWNSPKQIIPLFELLGINCTIYEKGEEKKSINEKVLSPQINFFPILKIYLDFKEKAKECSTYGLNWENCINKKTNRIHTIYRQLFTNTGRLSSGSKKENAPNMQNLPSDKLTRSCFIPEEGNIIIDCDYSGQESIVLVNESKDESLLNFYQKGLSDMHSYVALLLFPEMIDKSPKDITNEDLLYIKKNFKDKRQIAKTAEFAVAYGGQGSTIAKNCQLSIEEGIEVYDKYFEGFPGLKKYFDLVFYKTSSNKYILFNNVTKRKFFFDYTENPYFKYKEDVSNPFFWQINENAKQIYKEFNKAKGEIQRYSQNYPIQGTSGDITKLAGVYFMKEIFNRDWFNKVKIVACVHDEYVIECPENLREEVCKCIEECMRKGAEPFCKLLPLDAEAIYGDHWVH